MLLRSQRNLICEEDTRPDGDHAGKKCEAALQEAPQEMVALMRRCWAKDPSKRPASFSQIAELLGTLRAALKDAPTSATTRTLNPMLGTYKSEQEEAARSRLASGAMEEGMTTTGGQSESTESL